MPYWRSQKPCSFGERECATGQPITPARGMMMSPLTVCSSLAQHPVLAQDVEQGQQGQPEDGEEIALDAAEQLHAETFQTVAADAAEHRVAGLRQIGVE